MIPDDLISTQEAAEIAGYITSETIRYYIRTKRLTAYRNPRGWKFVSKAEVEEKLVRPDFIVLD
ncbi:MAG: helix-turn-helix domain-containing protein [Myxacorys californica WJT36-NPBG1]|jgi:hypothetical protein|nr:helix-turn-helix domain-containing protein [Myxacorys californica WJT36-NPBG1]